MAVWITKGMTNAEQEALAVWPLPASSNHVGGNWFPDGRGQRLKTIGDKLSARISCSWLRRYQPHAAIGKRVATSSIHGGIAPGRFTGKDFTGGVVSNWDVEVL